MDQEMENTRKVLERCPEEKWNWKPHEKSGTRGWLAGHVATMVDWLPTTIKTQELDYAPVGGPSFTPPKIDNRQQLLAEFDKNVSAARAALAGVSDAEMMKNWRLLAGGQDFQPAARRLHSRHGAQPSHPSPRAAHRVSSPPECRRPGSLRPERRRNAAQRRRKLTRVFRERGAA